MIGNLDGKVAVVTGAAHGIGRAVAHDLAVVGAKIGASVLVPSASATTTAQSSAVRLVRFGVDSTEDGHGMAAALAQIVAQGMSPEEAVPPVINGVRAGELLPRGPE